MLQKQGQLKYTTTPTGKITAKPDLKSAAGNGVVRKRKIGTKGIMYRKIYKTNEARYSVYLLCDANFAVERKADKVDVALTGLQGAAGGGLGGGYIVGELAARNKPKKIGKYRLGGALGGASVLGGLAAYQNYRKQKKNV